MSQLPSIVENLPEHLKERTRCVGQGTSHGDFVLYWMASAMRIQENPALDVAQTIAAALGKPLLVYQGLSQRYKYASDRHHTFIMQGVCDLQSQCKVAGISYAFHLDTGNDCGAHLANLAADSAVTIVEEMPVDPQRRFLAAVKRSCDTPIYAVDTACVVPMQLVGRAHTRAFEFRSKTKRMFEERTSRDWPKLSVEAQPFDIQKSPFTPVELSVERIPDWVARCDIDHGVGPVVDTVGGSVAGYERWEQFKQNRLASYHRKRNNPLTDGASRMSAYLHYGMVSPMRIAREAAEIDNDGSAKFLDELLIWRELAYGFCFYRRDHDRISALPDWALASLREHQGDDRQQLFSWEQLARAKTGVELWDAAQLSLLRQGELHNNVRMTWGKAFLQWTRSPEEALQLMTDLNHRYALDGRDPCSYGGLLWCLGQFDRPFEPESDITGVVRGRSVADHASRINVAAYRRKTSAVRFRTPNNIAIVGAGISGAIAARSLHDHGFDVTMFDKSRGIGGRMATRRVQDKPAFDHGAQYFTCRDARFQRYVESWRQLGLVARWPCDDQRVIVLENGVEKSESNSVRRYVAVPRMKDVCRHLVENIPIEFSTRIMQIQPEKMGAQEQQQWNLHDQSGSQHRPFDKVIFAIPADQTVEILKNSQADAADTASLCHQLAAIKMDPCWALMITLESPLPVNWVGAFVHQSPIRWIARNNTKPRRPSDHEHLVIHACSDWTVAHWDDHPDSIMHELMLALKTSTGIDSIKAIHSAAHRWKYSIPAPGTQFPEERAHFSSDRSVIACGDWAGGARVEGAFLSGVSAAGIVLRSVQHMQAAAKQSMLF